MRLQLHLMQPHSVRQSERQRQASVVSAEEVVAPGSGAHAASGTRAASAGGGAAALEEDVRCLCSRIAARYRTYTKAHVTNWTATEQIIMYYVVTLDIMSPTTITAHVSKMIF